MGVTDVYSLKRITSFNRFHQNFKLAVADKQLLHVKYAQAIWSPYKKKYVQAIEYIQKHAMKRVTRIKYLPYEKKLRHVCLPTVAYRCVTLEMIETFVTLMSRVI